MKKSKLFLTLLATLLIFSGSTIENKCRILGEVTSRPQSKQLLLVKAGDYLRSPEVIRIPIIHGKFTYDLSYSNVEAYNLVLEDQFNKGSWRNNLFFPTNGTVNVALYDDNNEHKNNITGGKANDDYNNYLNVILPKYFDFGNSYNEKMDSLRKIGKYESDTVKVIRNSLTTLTNDAEKKELFTQLGTLRREGLHLTSEAKMIQNEFNKSIKRLNSEKLAYIKKNPSVATYFVLMQSFKESSENYNTADLEKLSKKFTNKYKSHPYTHQLSTRTIKVGEKYFDITLNDINGNDYKLSEIINGKFAIIDIWSPWCGSCLTKSRALKSVYKEFKSNDFEIVGVSSKYYKIEDVENTLNKGKYPWITLIDTPNWKSEINVKYDILNSGGVIAMVDKEGVVLAINPTIEYIKKTLVANLE